MRAAKEIALIYRWERSNASALQDKPYFHNWIWERIMDEHVQKALEQGHVIDITTTGRKSGLPRRIEIAFYNMDGRLYLWGRTPSHRDWFANLQADPEFTVHLKGSVRVDLPARARIVVDEAERREIFSKLIQLSESGSDLEAVIESSPLVEVVIETDRFTGF